jgi:hypothetical protein
MQSEFLGQLSGSVYYRTLILRGKTIWASPNGEARSGARPLVTFQTKQTSRYNFSYSALSACGKMAFKLEAVSPPLVGLPKFIGSIQTENGLFANVVCSRETAQILSIKIKSPFIHITATKTGIRSEDSDIIFAEQSTGDIVRIVRNGYDETFGEQLASLFDLGLCRRGVFGKMIPVMDPIGQCLLAGLCIYFYQLELLFNSEGSFG